MEEDNGNQVLIDKFVQNFQVFKWREKAPSFSNASGSNHANRASRRSASKK